MYLAIDYTSPEDRRGKTRQRPPKRRKDKGKMNILCVSDTTQSLAFSPNVKEIYKDTDIILSCGDMPVESYDYLSTMLRRDVFYVYGNHNLSTFKYEMDREYRHLMKFENDFTKKFYGFMVDGKCMIHKRTGLIIAGLGGSMLYNDGDSQYTEAKMKWRIRRLVPTLLRNKRKYGRYLDILITHAPPRGIGDGEDQCHKGFECFLSFMDRFKPKYLLHGHVHLTDLNSQRVTQYKDTKVINVFGSYMIKEEEIGAQIGR